jgi:membrane associated rhomboid family serine protease
MASGPDLFVVCKNCGAEVSPYITECPYCGTRLRKRAPKIERDGTIAQPKVRRSRRTRPAGPPRGERRIPGVAAPAFGTRPWATIAIVALSLGMFLALQWLSDFDVRPLDLSSRPQTLLYATFAYFNGWYQLAVLGAIGLYGWLLERRHGPIVTFLVFICCAAGGIAIASLLPDPVAAGGNGGALGLLAAWAVPDLIARRRGEETDSDLLGAAVVAACVLMTPVVATSANWLAAVGGGVIGLVLGVPLARLHRAAA